MRIKSLVTFSWTIPPLLVLSLPFAVVIAVRPEIASDSSHDLLQSSDIELFSNLFHTSSSQSAKYNSLLEILASEKMNRVKDECPPCFNCLLPAFECTHFANCSEYDGKCDCPVGF